MYRTDTRDYPEEAIREALLNSIVHRDYSFSGSNLINVYEDRIEFVSLGGLVSGLELKSIFLGVSQSRNPNLASVFYRMKLIESYGRKYFRRKSVFPKQTENSHIRNTCLRLFFRLQSILLAFFLQNGGKSSDGCFLICI